MKKKKYAIIAFVFGICVTVCSGTIVLSAQEQTEKENEILLKNGKCQMI